MKNQLISNPLKKIQQVALKVIFDLVWPLVSQWTLNIIKFDIFYCSLKLPVIV